MATYITLVSLLQDLNQHLNLYHRTFGLSEQGFCPFTKEEIKSLLHAVASIEFFVRHRREELMKNPTIEKKIVGLIREAGNCVDYWAVECFPDLSLKRGIVRECSRLPEITREIVSIKQELKQVFRDAKVKIQEVRSSSGQSSTLLSPSRRTPNIEGKLVGLEMDSITMLDNLYGYTSKLKVLPIIGMGGIGKTTFARKLYDDPLVVHHFYVRAWVTVSQQYQLRDMLLGVLRCITIVPDEIQERSNEELREHVYKILKGKRYLIVLDDIWDTKGWDELKRLFPEDKNGSRIM